MMSVIMIEDMNDEACAQKIQNALSNTRIPFEIKLERKVVVVEGDNDLIRLAKQIISDAGFCVM